MIGASPPGPTRCGSTLWSTKAALAAASKALPPRSSTDIATALAIQWVVATAPKVPRISGRVVKFICIGKHLWQAACIDRPDQRRCSLLEQASHGRNDD